MDIVMDNPTCIASEQWMQNHFRYQVWISYFRDIYMKYNHIALLK